MTTIVVVVKNIYINYYYIYSYFQLTYGGPDHAPGCVRASWCAGRVHHIVAKQTSGSSPRIMAPSRKVNFSRKTEVSPVLEAISKASDVDESMIGLALRDRCLPVRYS